MKLPLLRVSSLKTFDAVAMVHDAFRNAMSSKKRMAKK